MNTKEANEILNEVISLKIGLVSLEGFAITNLY